jgi:uncharacterized repeat protein (TIGR01451 family)
MRTLKRALLSLLLTIPIFAQGTDVSVRINQIFIDSSAGQTDRVAVGQTIDYTFGWDGIHQSNAADYVLEVDVPGVITLTDESILTCTGADPIRCTFQPPPTGGFEFLHLGVRIDAPGTHTTTARIVNNGSTPDPDPSNNVVTHTFQAFALPQLELLQATQFDRMVLAPGGPGSFITSVRNVGSTTATNVTFTVTLPDGGAVVAGASRDPNATCNVANGALVCNAASLAKNEGFTVDVNFVAPDRLTGQPVTIRMVAASAEGDAIPSDNEEIVSIRLIRQFAVTNTADEGSGSLRQAMLDVNALCPIPIPCGIVFRIPGPVPGAGYFTIQPRTALPELSGFLFIDGKSQIGATGDSNPDGPEIEIDGSLVRESGLRIRPDCQTTIEGLAVNGFAGYGILIYRPNRTAETCINDVQTIADNYVGVDPRGRIAKPVQRGIAVFDAFGVITNNLVSGNQRSGIYVSGGEAEIRDNRIGVTSTGAPLGNGASGMFLDLGYAEVFDNVIANNNGAAISRTSRGALEIRDNSMFDNLLQGIDADLNLRSPNRANDLDDGGFPNHPVLFSATYDPARSATIVRGRLDSEDSGALPTFHVDVYASAGLSDWALPQAEQLVATEILEDGHANFEIVIPQDLRGKWITATHTRYHIIGFVRPPGGIQSEGRSRPGNTSELSDAVFVH